MPSEMPTHVAHANSLPPMSLLPEGQPVTVSSTLPSLAADREAVFHRLDCAEQISTCIETPRMTSRKKLSAGPKMGPEPRRVSSTLSRPTLFLK